MPTTLQNFYKATITKNWTATTGDFNVSVKPTTSSGLLVISPNNTTLREIIRYTATGTNAYGDFVTISDVADRGLGGTTAQTHTIGETIRMNITAEHWADMQADIASIVSTYNPSYNTTVTFSSSDILNLFTTPKTLVAAPGAGKIIVPDLIVFSLTYGTTTYAGGGVVRVQYAGTTTQLLGTTNVASTITSASSIVSAGNFTPISTSTVALTPGINDALELQNASAAFTTGNSTMKVYIQYRILTL